MFLLILFSMMFLWYSSACLLSIIKSLVRSLHGVQSILMFSSYTFKFLSLSFTKQLLTFTICSSPDSHSFGMIHYIGETFHWVSLCFLNYYYFHFHHQLSLFSLTIIFLFYRLDFFLISFSSLWCCCFGWRCFCLEEYSYLLWVL